MNNYYMPAEWSKHKGTLISWPTNKETWEGIELTIQESMALLAATISNFELLYISIKKSDNKNSILNLIKKYECNESNIHILDIPNNDSWTRDYGPNYVCKKTNDSFEYGMNNWGYNAWGGKYPPWDLDNNFKTEFAKYIGCKNVFNTDMILEGGSIDVNGQGILLTTKSCLLNKNRNPKYNPSQIESKLKEFLGISEIIWIDDGIVGDDTDGHIDDFVRFVDEKTIVCAFENNPSDENYHNLNAAYNLLINNDTIKNNKINVIKLPMPKAKYFQDFRIPASYANFYFINGAILVPIFDDENDQIALDIFSKLRVDLKVIGIPGLNFVRGLGGIHCLTQQIY